MSIWYIIWIVNIALFTWSLLVRLRPCGCVDWEAMRHCTRLHIKPCHVDWVALDEAPAEIGGATVRWGKLSEEHVWTNDEFLRMYDPH